MLILALNTGHDGAIAAVEDRRLLWSLESEKNSLARHLRLDPMSILDLTARLGAVPDVIAVGGWNKETHYLLRDHKPDKTQFLGHPHIETGYLGADAMTEREMNFFGSKVKLFSSSHTRSHIMMGAGMAPPDDAEQRAVLVWEGAEGTFYLLDERWQVLREIPVLNRPGDRYSFVFALADPGYADGAIQARLDASGKLMALAAYGDPSDADAGVTATVDRLLTPGLYPAPKRTFKDSPLYNAGVEAEQTKIAGALLTERLFDVFARAAREHLPAGIPLYISGGCGLNCDWNMKWLELGHFSSVFVPPCTNDSGSAIGTALDALAQATGDPRVEWDVYCGLEFEWDRDPDPARWQRHELDNRELAAALEAGRVVAWVQGRWEIGPRALGNRSLLAEPSRAATRDRLNQIKLREDYRPIAPCCRLEDAGRLFSSDLHDPYMLYFRTVRSPDLGAVTHVDGSARVQTVKREENEPLHSLLTAFGERTGAGVLCNTSLNFKGLGFINRTSDLVAYCEGRDIDDFVVGDGWYRRVKAS